MKKIILFVICICSILLSCKSQDEGIIDISVEDLQVVLKNNEAIQLVDVRTSQEWSKGVIKNAITIDVTSGSFEDLALKKLDKSKPVYIYCRSGGRSKIASDLLLKKGFKPYNVLGGYMEWKEMKQ